MKKSAAVPAVLLSSLSLTLMAGCANQSVTEMRRCIDEKGVVRPDQECENRRGYAGGYYGGILPYRGFAYGGQEQGGRVMGFKSTPTDGARVVAPGGRVIRGGIGSTGRSFGGFGG